jgi:hypothetical protein
VGTAAAVPVIVGLWGVLSGFGAPGLFADSHYRYLSAILFGMGVAFWVTIPQIEHQATTFRLLCGLVVLGGLARAATGMAAGIGPEAGFGLFMELAVTPGLFLWRERVARLAAVDLPGEDG